MKKFWSDLLKKLDISGRDLPVLLVSLLLAFSIWLFYNLSLRYSDFLQVPVVAQSNIEGHSARSADKVDVVARCRTTGFNMIRIKAFAKRFPVVLTFDRMHRAGDETFYVTTSEIQEFIPEIFGENVTMEYCLTDTLFFRFPYESYKAVPVRPVYELDFKPQYTIVGTLKVSPDTVLVYGEPSRLGNIEYVSTEPFRLARLDSDTRGVVRLEKMRGIRYADANVHYTVDVERYVEIRKDVAVEVRNVPRGKEMMVYPSVIDARFRCRFPLKGSPADSVVFYVDYNDYISSITGKCVVKTDAVPSDILGYNVSPEVVECVVRERW